MSSHLFESQLEKLARTLTEQFGVQVTCQGDNAWTDGRQIVLPSLPDPLDENLERMMVGYLDHEMAHVAFSDFDVAEQFAKKYPGYEAMLNVVEDALIERRAMQRWPGVRANLDAMFAQVRGRIIQLIAQRTPFDRFCTAIYLKLAHYRDMLGLDQEAAGYEDLLDRFPAVHDTSDAAELAEQVLERWLRSHPQRPQKLPAAKPNSNGPAQPSPQGQGSSGAGTHKGDAQPNDQARQDSGTNDASQNTGGKGASDQNASSTADSGTGRPQNSSSQSDGDPHAADPAAEPQAGARRARGSHGVGGTSLVTQALTEAIAEAVAGMSNASEYRAYTKKHDRIDTVAPATDQAVQSMLATGTDVVRRLRRGLANTLRSAEKRWWRDDQLRGSLSPRTLYRLATERTRLDIFRVRSTVQGRSTAVSVLLDASGSMTSRKMEVARQAMRVLLEALADLKIATEALTFTTGDRFSLAEAARMSRCECAPLQTRFSRFGNLEIGVVKEFGESVKRALTRLPSVRGSGLTPLGEAMQIAATRLGSRPENRKIMVVLTDGKAGCETGDVAATQHAQHVAARITKGGLELVGVGIQDDSLCAIVADTIVIHKLEDLPAQLCKLLGRTLQKGLSHVG